jgi:phosphopantetheinyl transferase
MRIARFAFAPEEVAQLEALSPEPRTERFYTLWTLKEACIKAFGVTLFEGLRGCVFTLEADEWRANLPTAGDWSAEVYRPRTSLLMAVISVPRTARWVSAEWPGTRTSWSSLARVTATG